MKNRTIYWALAASMLLGFLASEWAAAQQCFTPRRHFNGFYSTPVYHAPKAVAKPVAVKDVADVLTDNSITYNFTINYDQFPNAQGNTVFGAGYQPASVREIYDVYSNFNLGEYARASLQLAADADAYGDAANERANQFLTGVVNTHASLTTRTAAVAEIVAKGNAASAALNAASAAPSETTIRAEASVGIGRDDGGDYGGGDGRGEESRRFDTGAADGPATSSLAVYTARCAKCHRLDSGKPNNAAKAFYPGKSLSPTSIVAILAAVKSGSMPPEDEPALSDQEAAKLEDEVLGLLQRGTK